jgi:hypothetical protein
MEGQSGVRATSGARGAIFAAGVALVVAALLVPVAVAADPPDGIVFDGVVNVTVREASAAGAEPGAPIADAEVTLLVTLNDFPEGELQSLTATTQDDGIATFANVARPEGDKPTVHLDAHAHQESSSRDNGCIVGTSWDGAATGIATEGPDELVIAATPSSSISCPPRPVVRGHVHDAAGHAIRIKSATVSIDAPPPGKGRTQRLPVDSKGAFELKLPEWDGNDGPTVLRITVTGAVTGHRTLANGCRQDLAQVGSRISRVALEVEGERLPIDVVTHEAVVAEACDAAGTPRPSSGGNSGGSRSTPAPTQHHVRTTLPPTDTALGLGTPGGRSGLQATALVVLVLAGIAGLAAGSLRRGRRR